MIDLIFLTNLVINKKINYLKHKIFYVLLVFWISLLINTFFSINFDNSILRAFGFIRFVILIFAIKYSLSINNHYYQKLIFKIWSITFFIVTFDLLFELLFGFNTFGYGNNMYGRLSGFLGEELKIGNYYFGFILLALTFIYYESKNISIFFLCFIVFFITSFVIGERSNFIKVFFIASLFFLIMDKKFIFKKILIFFSIITLLGLIITFNDNYNDRFYKQIIKIDNIDPKFSGESKFNISNYLKKSHYGAHYDTAIQIFKDNYFFGVGLKNFRIESTEAKYINKEYLNYTKNASTHPHQVHLEFLSETGLFGYACFILFIIYFLNRSIYQQFKNRNLYQLSGILFLFGSLLPLIPSGSFFTTYGATIFWINLALIESFND